MKSIILIIALAVALSLFGCARTSEAETDGSEIPAPTVPALEATPSPQPTATPVVKATPSPPPQEGQAALAEYPLYLPLPYYYVFYGEVPLADNVDAFLHNTAVNYYSTRNNSISPHLCIPSLRLLDEWDAGDGATYYLFHAVLYQYYDLAQDLADGNTGRKASSSSGGLLRIKLTPKGSNAAVENYWGFEAVEILESPPWGTAGADIQTLCGDRPIAEQLHKAYNTGNTNIWALQHIRDILPSDYAFDPAELLAEYLKFFFPK